MEMIELLKRYGDVRFEPAGKDEITSYMVVETCKVHVRIDDVSLAKGMTFSQIHPLISKLSSNIENAH
jgi:hypothetical protein